VGLAQEADGNTGLGRLGGELFGTGKAPPDELDGGIGLLASTEGYCRLAGQPPAISNVAFRVSKTGRPWGTQGA